MMNVYRDRVQRVAIVDFGMYYINVSRFPALSP